MSIAHELLYASPTLLGIAFLVACAIASTSILYFCRPARGPGYWATCCWVLLLSYGLFAADHFDNTIHLSWLTDALLIAAQAFMMLGVFRFLNKPLPFWIVPASVIAMLLVDLGRLLAVVSQPVADAAYCALVIGLAVNSSRSLRHNAEQNEVRAVRTFIVFALGAYALAHAVRLSIGLGHGLRGGSSALFEHDSIPLLSFYSGLPFLVIALVALTAMSLHRTLAESREHARQARENLMRFEQLMRISSAAMLLVRDGLIVDSNPKLGGAVRLPPRRTA